MGMGAGLVAAGMQGGTAVLLAALGELVLERSGVLNLGIEGIMLVGALTGFAASHATGNPALALGAAACAGMLMGLLHGVFTVMLGASQVVAGLALMILGTGISGFFGQCFIGQTAPGIAPVAVPLLADIPLVGPALFRHDPLVYAAVLLVPVIRYFLMRTTWGLAVRAVGENPEAADVQGVPVIRVRMLATAFAGFMAGLAGAHLSLAYNRMWIERMVAGRGWIALAVVIFSLWRPGRALIGAYLFGVVGAASFRMQALGSRVSAPLLQTLPYVTTIVALVLIAWRARLHRDADTPAALTIPFRREERS
ncbi:ABC transporter permease [Candidatus Fermentibacteria bacterium]|nr:ABC transporter permease [Candidatus Fermentibacteria bacterium]